MFSSVWSVWSGCQWLKLKPVQCKLHQWQAWYLSGRCEGKEKGKCLNGHSRVDFSPFSVRPTLAMMSYYRERWCSLAALPAQRCPSLRYIIITELRDTIPSSNADAGLLLLDYHSGSRVWILLNGRWNS